MYNQVSYGVPIYKANIQLPYSEIRVPPSLENQTVEYRNEPINLVVVSKQKVRPNKTLFAADGKLIALEQIETEKNKALLRFFELEGLDNDKNKGQTQLIKLRETYREEVSSQKLYQVDKHDNYFFVFVQEESVITNHSKEYELHLRVYSLS